MARDIQIKIGAKDTASKVLKNVGTNVKKLDSAVARASKSVVFSLKNMVAGFAAFSTVRAGFSFIADEFERIDKAAKKATQLGLVTNELIALRFAAQELSGASATTVDMALQRMTRRVSEAAAGTGEAVKAIQELKLSAVDLNRAGPAQAFRMIADAMKGVESQQDRLRLAFKLFDSEGAVLVNTLNAGGDALLEFKRRAKEAGITVSEGVVEDVQKANAAVNELMLSLKGLGTALAGRAAPTVTAGAGAATKGIQSGLPIPGIHSLLPTTSDIGRFFKSFAEQSVTSSRTLRTEEALRQAVKRNVAEMEAAIKAEAKGKTDLLPLPDMSTVFNKGKETAKSFADGLSTGFSGITGGGKKGKILDFLKDFTEFAGIRGGEIIGRRAVRIDRDETAQAGTGTAGTLQATQGRLLTRGSSTQRLAMQGLDEQKKANKQLAEIDGNLKTMLELEKQGLDTDSFQMEKIA